jgi:hypothetical protein
MKKPQLLIKARKAKDKKLAKLTEQWINYEYEKHGEFVEAVERARLYIEKGYGIKTSDQPWELVMQAYFVQVDKKENG